ncbi:unnamed protein product [Meloidogyne enterolobii]|uniref:Uncharacterized protein n=1 Tax=Meloidogyne enterolobii TaxID=390850 RepID=A0ACB0XKW0_MELEN
MNLVVEQYLVIVAHKIHIQAHITLNLGSKSLEELKNNLLEELTEYTANTVLLCAKQSDSEIIFNVSTKFTGAGRVWLLSEAASNAKNIPKGALSIRLKQSMISSLRDGLAVAKAGIKSFKQNNSLKFNPPKGCQHSVSEWTNFAEEKLFDELKRQPIYETLSGEQINFNERGDRKGMTYEILNAKEFVGPLVVVGNLNGRGELILDDRAIIWPGGLRRKPSELTLPKHLRVTLVVDPPFVYAFKVDEYSRCSKLQFLNNPTINVEGFQVSGPWFPCEKLENNKKEFYCCSGMAVELLFLISEGSKRINGEEKEEKEEEELIVADNSFSFELKLNDSYGAVLLGEQEGEGFKLTGMIGELDADRADMAIGALSINPERDRFIDFSEPWLYHGIQILERWRPKRSPMESFLQPLKNSLWLSLVIAVFLVAFVVYFLDLKSPFERFYSSGQDPLFEKAEQEERVSIGESLWFSWGVLLNSGVCEKTPRSFSARVLGLAWCGFCMIMVASYTANLAAFLVLDQPERSLSGVNDPRLRNPSANFSLATITHSATYQYFKRHVELSTVFRKMEANNQPNARSAIQALLNGSISAFVWDSVRLEFEAANNCELRTRGALFGRSAYGIGLRKGSAWTPHISQAILRLSENGTLERLEQKWIRSPNKNFRPCFHFEPKAPARLGLRSMRDGLVLVASGILLGAGMSILERKRGKSLQKQKKRQQLARQYAAKWLELSKRKREGTDSLLLRLSAALCDEKRKQKEERINKNIFIKTTPMFVPELNFGTKPCNVYCPRCHHFIQTITKPIFGRFALICSFICIFLLLFPCALAPIFLTCFADYEHFCSNEECKHKIGRYRRCFKPKFFV